VQKVVEYRGRRQEGVTTELNLTALSYLKDGCTVVYCAPTGAQLNDFTEKAHEFFSSSINNKIKNLYPYQLKTNVELPIDDGPHVVIVDDYFYAVPEGESAVEYWKALINQYPDTDFYLGSNFDPDPIVEEVSG
jgi:hypothetical protein